MSIELQLTSGKKIRTSTKTQALCQFIIFDIIKEYWIAIKLQLTSRTGIEKARKLRLSA